ncbi:MAG TPA: hypothetical protein DC049_06490 [Spirochaetia bacterium]|nr:hypothetical protein [Spirochaetia bacterium]
MKQYYIRSLVFFLIIGFKFQFAEDPGKNLYKDRLAVHIDHNGILCIARITSNEGVYFSHPLATIQHYIMDQTGSFGKLVSQEDGKNWYFKRPHISEKGNGYIKYTGKMATTEYSLDIRQISAGKITVSYSLSK